MDRAEARPQCRAACQAEVASSPILLQFVLRTSNPWAISIRGAGSSLNVDLAGLPLSSVEAEVVPEIKRIFAMVDTDRDGQLDTSEWSGAVARLQGLG